MPRKKRDRRLLAPPAIKGLSVYGPKNRTENVTLYFEEYETIKLLDYENMTQEEAAVCMGVSRPTLTRIYESARNKVARSMVEAKDLIIRGGSFLFDDNWFFCNHCHARFNRFVETEKNCPVCNSVEVITLNEYYSAE